MSKLILIVLVVAAASLIGASVVFAQDSTQTTPGAAITNICPNGGVGPADGTGYGAMRGTGNGAGDGTGPVNGTGNLEQMQQRHEQMSANVPPEMQERHAAMGAALASGDTERIQQLREENRANCPKRNAQT